MRLARRTALAVLVSGCVRPTPPVPPTPPRYMVGGPYQLGGTWSYPREDFSLVQTGLGSIAADARAGRRTANGEVHDPGWLTAAHRTLQLPAVVAVTNLESGLRIEVRVNDRGPANPGRVIELSRRAAELIGLRGTAQLRIEVVGEASRAIAGGLPNPEAAPLAVAAAPIGAVGREDLAPPPGANQATRVRQAAALPGAGSSAVATPLAPTVGPIRLPEQVARAAPSPGRLWIEAASFSRRDMAVRQAARLRGRVDAVGSRGRESFRVRAGPFSTVAEADLALEQSLRAGVSEARILVD